LVRQLLEHETLDKEQILVIFANLHRHPERPAWTGSPQRRPSPIPPVPAPAEPDGIDLDELDKVPPRRQSADAHDGWTDPTPVGDWAPPKRH
ncbi:MAG: cell division protein FtsH, partial [Propionibacteriaceae bacterium]|jgi:cell division protease FtsH|nr:cell division protein FtsH [Propionibacteriaceae bacterium]